MKLIATADTFLKTLPTQASELKESNLPDQIVSLKQGTELDITEHFFHEGNTGTTADDHFFVQLAQPLSDQQNLRWFVYSPHVKLEGIASQDQPAPPQPVGQTDFGKKIKLPGISRPVGIYEPVYHEPTASHFTWNELTMGGTRIPVNADITLRIVKLCKYMDKVRSYLGDKPITVTSGYRDPVSNKREGGVPNSRHTYGDAIDFRVEGMSVVDTFYKLKAYHKVGGLAVGSGFVHIDLRSHTKPSRWHYKGGPKVDLW